MNRLYTSGLLVLLLAVAMGTVAVVRSATTVHACGYPLVPWLGNGEAPSDPDLAGSCPAQRSDRRREVVGETGSSVILLLVGSTMVVLGRRRDRREQSSLPPDPFDASTSMTR